MELKPDVLPQKTLKLKFESVDTAELQNVEIAFEGDRAIFKVGEGESNHYQILMDRSTNLRMQILFLRIQVVQHKHLSKLEDIHKN